MFTKTSKSRVSASEKLNGEELTYEEIQQEEGVYVPFDPDNDDDYLIVLRGIPDLNDKVYVSVLFYAASNGLFQPASTHYWEKRTFVRVDRKVKFSVKDV